MTVDKELSSPDMRQAVGQMAVRAYGKYFLVRKLAEGGMAEIFLAKQVGVEGFEKNVVIKRMLPHLSQAPDFVAMFLDEARLAATLAHPNIVQISDLGLADGCYFICMEYLAGEDFATVVRVARRRNEQVPLQIVLRVIAQAAAGLHYAHEATDQKGEPLHLVHRDVSPSNIFITYSGQVKMLDFGIAKAESRVTTTGAGVVKGKYQYMSPEQARGDPVDRRADVFSLGVSLYEALTGVRPFARDTDLAVLKAVLDGEYQPIRVLRPDLPVEVEQIVLRAMAQEPEHRYASALEMATEIERYLGATTSASGGQALTTFMTAFFGQERVQSKTRIESLDELARRGVDVPGHPNPLSRKTDPSLKAVEIDIAEQTKAIGLPSEIRREQRRRTGFITAAAIAALVVGIGGTLAVVKLLQPAQTTPVDAGTLAVVDAGAAPLVIAPPVIDAGPAEVAEARDAGEVKKEPGKVKPVVLTTVMVQKAIGQNKARFERCFKEHKADLPGQTGTVMVQFTIAGSGKVSQATTDRPGTGVSKCLEGVVKAISFPRHVDLEVRVPIALNYDVR